MVGGNVALKANSVYYFQVQGQMGVTGKTYTDFVVFASHGHFIQRIDLRYGKACILSLSGSGKTVCAQSYSQKQSYKELHQLKQTNQSIEILSTVSVPSNSYGSKASCVRNDTAISSKSTSIQSAKSASLPSQL